MINNGPVQIGTNIEHVDGIDNRHLTIVTPPQSGEQPQPVSPEPKSTPGVHLNTKRSTKLNFFRVVKALCEQGFFVDASGAKADDKAVFEALSSALGEDFSDYSGHLSEGLNHHKLDTRSEIFQTLREAYEEYETSLIEQRKNR